MKNQELYDKIRVISNKYRFEILELTQDKPMTITDLSKKLGLSYNSCADYVTILEKNNLISKHKEGRDVFIKAEFELDKCN